MEKLKWRKLSEADGFEMNFAGIVRSTLTKEVLITAKCDKNIRFNHLKNRPSYSIAFLKYKYFPELYWGNANENGGEWKDVPGYNGRYQAHSTRGIVRTKPFEVIRSNGRPYTAPAKVLSNHLRGKKSRQYHSVAIFKGENIYRASTHRLIAETFIPNPENKPLAHHKNNNSLDNRASNLAWVTLSENILDSVMIGTANFKRKTVVVMDATGKEIRKIFGIREASKVLKINRNSLSHCCNGKLESVKGLRFKLA